MHVGHIIFQGIVFGVLSLIIREGHGAPVPNEVKSKQSSSELRSTANSLVKSFTGQQILESEEWVGLSFNGHSSLVFAQPEDGGLLIKTDEA